MKVIADNLNTRNRAYMDALRGRDKNALSALAGRLGHADMINIQCSLDGSGDDDILPWAVEVVQEAAPGCGISIDSRNVIAVRGALEVVKNPALVNYISMAEPEDPDELLELVAASGASLVIRAARATPPSSLEAKLQIIEELLEWANAADIPNERLFADPSVVHLGSGAGQRHLANSTECIMVLREMVEPPVRTIAWISNVSTGLPHALGKRVEAAFFLYAAGAGLDAAMVDVLDEDIKQAVYLVKSFRDEIIFTPADLA
ncbi:MAG: dihydropteroate synthase [Thermodesulfovibrionales bacterium]|nr:dihydropteroate synthase [Thermodesulfovibrionales bacterium]